MSIHDHCQDLKSEGHVFTMIPSNEEPRGGLTC